MRVLQSRGERFLADDFGKTEVGQLHCEVLVHKENVFRFDVTMDNISFMLWVVSATRILGREI